MKKKTLYIIGGVALALGIGLFVWNRSKKDGDISKKVVILDLMMIFRLQFHRN